MLLINLPAWVYLGLFLLSICIFWGTVKGDVPLFLSSSQVVDAVLKCVKQENAASFVDIGAGVGTVIIPLAEYLPALRIVALEKAPLPYLLAFWRCRTYRNVKVHLSSLWSTNLQEYAVVFAFLSPIVMPRVAQKIGQKCKKAVYSSQQHFQYLIGYPKTLSKPLTYVKPSYSAIVSALKTTFYIDKP